MEELKRPVHRMRSISVDATQDVKFALHDSVFCDDIMTVSANRTSLCLHSRVFEKMLIDPLHQYMGQVKIYDATIKLTALNFCIRNTRFENTHLETPADVTARIQLLNDCHRDQYHDNISQQLPDDVTSGDCLYASRVYLLEGLCRVCKDHLKQSLSVDNVSWIYTLAYTLDLKELKEKCFQFMSEESEDVLVSPNVLDLSKEALLEIIDRDDFLADEEMIFDAATRWAVMSDQNISLTDMVRNSHTIRQGLGRGLYFIRFPVLPPNTFENKVIPSGILTQGELDNMEDYFKTKERSIEIIFDPVKCILPEFRLWNECDTIVFNSSVSLKLHSLKISGLRYEIKEIVTLRISKTKSQRIIAEESFKPETQWSLHDQEVQFKEPVLLQSKYLNYLRILTDPVTVYTCMSGSTTQKIQGVNMTATYFTDSFVSAVLSPAFYLPPSYLDSSSSEEENSL